MCTHRSIITSKGVTQFVIYDNEFTCPDGHTFRANAKLRARCPECTKMARRVTKSKIDVVTTNPIVNPEPVENKPTEPEPKSEPVARTVELVRRGRSRLMPTPAKKPAVTTKRKTPPRVNGRFVSSKKTVPSTQKKSVALVKKHVVHGKTSPKVQKLPSKTAIARHIAPKSYVDEIIEKYG